jgi:hypothetical protein
MLFSQSWAVVRIVDINGTGSYTTISAAATAAQAGDTVLVKAGTYNELVSPPRSGTSAAAPIVFKTYAGQKVTISAQDTRSACIQVSGRSYVTFDGFDLVGATGSAFATSGTGTDVRLVNCNIYNCVYGIDLSSVSNSLISHCKIYDLDSRAVGGQCGANCVVEYCEMYNTVSALLMGGSLTQVQNLVIRYNYAHDNRVVYGGLHNDNIFVFSATNTKMYGNIVKNSVEGLFVQNCQGGEFYNNISFDRHTYGMLIDNSPNFKIYNNITYSNTYGGIWITGGSTNCEIYNNIVCEPTGNPLEIEAGATATLKTDYNLCFSNNGVVALYGGTFYTLSTYQQNTTNEDHGRSGDPLFNDAANGNFHLRYGSQAIDAGSNLGLTQDMEGNPRPQGAGYDIGCYETDGIPPNAPTDLQASPVSEHRINLYWMAPSPAADGDVAIYYIIKCFGTRIGTSLTRAYVDSNLDESTTRDYEVYAVDDFENVSVIAAGGSFRTTVDANGPVVTQVISLSLNKVQVFFDEPVDQTTSETVNSYQLSGGVTVSSAVRQVDQKSVIVTTSQMTESSQYTITISNVKDASTAHNNMTQTQKQFTAMYKFEDNFESGNISKWTPSTSSVWSVVDDAGDKSLFINAAVPAERLLVNRTYNVMSFDADIKGFGTSVYRNLSILIGLQDTSNYYHINFAGTATTSYNGIFKVVNKTETRLATGAATLTETAQYHHIRVTWNGATGEIKAYFDQPGTPVFSITDATFTSGKVGVWSKGSKQGYFDNVEVVSYIRTDAWATGMNDRQLKTPLVLGLGCPNPVTLQQVHVLFANNRDLALFDLKGLSVDGQKVSQTGIYLVTDRKSNVTRKVIVTGH